MKRANRDPRPRKRARVNLPRGEAQGELMIKGKGKKKAQNDDEVSLYTEDDYDEYDELDCFGDKVVPDEEPDVYDDNNTVLGDLTFGADCEITDSAGLEMDLR